MNTPLNAIETFKLTLCHTLTDFIYNAVKLYPQREALREFNRTTKTWDPVSYETLGSKIQAWQRALMALGLKRHSRVAILLPNSVDHVLADQSVLANALTPVPLHAIDTPGSSAFIIIDSQAELLITQNYARWEAIRDTGVPLPDLKYVLITDPEWTSDAASSMRGPRLLSISDWQQLSESTCELPEPPSANELAAIVYTSGTTGRPKGVMLSHHNIVSNVKATLQTVSPAREGYTFLSFLPLSHTFERTVGYYLALATGCTIAYNRSVLLLSEDLKIVKPDVIISVPRVYERVFARLQQQLKKASAMKRRLFDIAVTVGWRDFCRRNHMPIRRNWWQIFDPILRATIVKKVKGALLQQFGGRLHIAIAGGAALNQRLAEIFCGLGLPIIQGYGMTETSPIIAGNCLELNQPDTVGSPFPNVQVRLGQMDEIQVKSPGVMQGYWNRPEDTRDAFTPDGWLKTGDVGAFNALGLLQIKGRIKEIIVTSTGEKISPTDIESALETDSLFAQTFLVGEGRPFMSLVVCLNPEEWPTFAQSMDLDPQDPASLQNPAMKTSLLRRAKGLLKDFPHYALPRGIVVTLDTWTIDNGALTPTLKLKRRVLLERYGKALQKLYSSQTTA